MVAIDLRTKGGQQTGRGFQVFHAQRQAVQEAQRVARHHRLFGGARFGAGPLERGGGHGVDVGVDCLDARNARLQQFHR
ncbi:hypothetical protein D3C73_1279750 [compost metagenome]